MVKCQGTTLVLGWVSEGNNKTKATHNVAKHLIFILFQLNIWIKLKKKLVHLICKCIVTWWDVIVKTWNSFQIVVKLEWTFGTTSNMNPRFEKSRFFFENLNNFLKKVVI